MQLKKIHDVPVDVDSFNELRTILYEQVGINLNDSKLSLVSSRLRGRIFELGQKSLQEYLAYLRSKPRGHSEWELFINAMTTNKTSFFREAAHFDYLEGTVLPKLITSPSSRPIRVWSAACSTGEEPYTIAMILKEMAGRSKFDYNIVATDIDTKVLAHARNGVYKNELLAPIPEVYRRGAVLQGSGDIAVWSKIRDEVKTSVNFQQLNLTKPPYPWSSHFDVIFCRNVLIYFDPSTIEKVARELFNAARPGAWLFTGHTESLQNVNTAWKFVVPSVYRKEGS
jgi:chemotaxis methyl-accepting protein methylase